MEKIDLSEVNVNYRRLKTGFQADCIWYFNDGTPKGKKLRPTGFGETKREALHKLKQNIERKQEEISFGEALTQGEVTIKTALDEFLNREKTGEYISDKTGKAKTPIAVEHDVETANALLFPCKDLMMLQFSKIQPANIIRWRAWVDKQTYKKGGKQYPYSCDKKNKAFRLLSEVVTPCFMIKGYNPMSAIKKWTVHTKQKTENDILTPDEIKKFLNYCLEDLSDHNRAQGALNILTYPRKGELLGLKAGDYNREKCILTIQRTLIRHTDGSLELSEDGYGKNERSLRNMVLNPYACAILDRLTDGKSPDELLFKTPNGNLINGRNYSGWFKRTLKSLQIKSQAEIDEL